MKLHWSPRSPYVRKVMIAAHEMGLADRFECVRTVVAPMKPVEAYFAEHPLNKIPALVLDDGFVVYDSRVICEYLDTLHDRPKLFPAAGFERLMALRNQALGDGMVDVAMIRLVERNKPEARRTPEIVAANERKTREAVARLEKDVAMLTDRPYDIGHIAIGTALGYLDFRFPDDNWRDGHPKLADWHAAFVARPSVIASPVVDDS